MRKFRHRIFIVIPISIFFWICQLKMYIRIKYVIFLKTVLKYLKMCSKLPVGPRFELMDILHTLGLCKVVKRLKIPLEISRNTNLIGDPGICIHAYNDNHDYYKNNIGYILKWQLRVNSVSLKTLLLNFYYCYYYIFF